MRFIGTEPGPDGMVPIRFQKPRYHKGEELVIWVDPKWLKGEGFEVTMERRLMVDGEGDNATLVTGPVCPFSVMVSSPVAVSQSFTVLS